MKTKDCNSCGYHANKKLPFSVCSLCIGTDKFKPLQTVLEIEAEWDAKIAADNERDDIQDAEVKFLMNGIGLAEPEQIIEAIADDK